MFAGPVFSREVTSAPRRPRLYVARAAYVGTLLVLLSTAWQVLTGTNIIGDTGDLARFGTTSLQLLAPLQIAVVLFFAAVSAAGAVAVEKDRRTLDLLLLSRLTNVELVIGKLGASLLWIISMILAAVPLFMLLALLGGVAFGQIARLFAIAFAAAVAAGSIGTLTAFWREKTFQAMSATMLVIVLWLAAGEFLAAGALGVGDEARTAGDWATAISPWRATLAAVDPFPNLFAADAAVLGLRHPADLFVLVAACAALVVNLTTIALVRVWNPARELREATPADDDRERPEPAGLEHHWHLPPHEAQGAAELPATGVAAVAAARAKPAAERRAIRTRRVWDNPILWREMRTWAYGRRVLLVRIAYLLLALAAAAGLHATLGAARAPKLAEVALPVAPLLVLSLVLINVQAVTSMTSERDARALDLLLVTDLTPPEIIFGKLFGALFNAKEMILLPAALCVYMAAMHLIGVENLLYLLGGWLVMVVFVAVLGIHCGMNYANSRLAIAVSVGTVFFLFVGVATCMRIMLAFSGSFHVQLQPFLAFMVGGGVGLLIALGWRNASTAIWIAAFACPFATFYSLTSLSMQLTLAVFLVVCATYGFTTAAMLIPALSEFDVATGRTTTEEG